MDRGKLIRFVFIVALWVFLCYVLISSTKQITGMTIFTIVASGIIIFVPLWKKYNKKDK